MNLFRKAVNDDLLLSLYFLFSFSNCFSILSVIEGKESVLNHFFATVNVLGKVFEDIEPLLKVTLICINCLPLIELRRTSSKR